MRNIPTSPIRGMVSARSSISASPTRHKSPIQSACLVADIEDLGIGSSFFSEMDLNESHDNSCMDKFTFIRIEQVHSGRSKRGEPEVILGGRIQKNGKETTVTVRGLWVECDYRVGTVISVTPPTFSSDIIIDGTDGCFLVYDPSTLISITTVADAVSCLRKAALSIKMQSAAADNPPTIHLVSGSVAHDVFEQGIQHPTKLDNVTDLIMRSVTTHLTTIFACGEVETSVQSKVVEILKGFRPWCANYLADTPIPGATVVDELKTVVPEISKSICIPQVFSLEESITSHGLGLKGKIDAVVLARFRTAPNEQYSWMVPLELKTGKTTSSTAHRAQTLLYTLLLSDRYDFPVRMGLLYYVASNVLLRLSTRSDELQALIMTRNRLAAACQADAKLPKPIDNAHNCRQCPQLGNCSVMVKLNGEDESLTNETIAAKLESISAVIDDSFYRKWEKLLVLEEEEALCSKKMTANCLRAALIDCQSSDNPGVFHRFSATFSISVDDRLTEITKGDPVLLYLAANLDHEVGIGFVSEATCERLIVSCDRDISFCLNRAMDFDAIQNHHLERITTIGNEFVIKKDELKSGFSLARMNLSRLYGPRFNVLRQLLCNGQPPQMRQPRCESGVPSTDLDEDQLAALQHCLAAEEYALLLGMPGTGKTTTLVALVRTLISQGAKILISSYTHSAVDNLLTKIRATGVSVLRLGNAERVEDSLKDVIINEENYKTIQAMRTAIQGTQVFGTTCLGSNHPILGHIEFDYCIVDEASQITVPAVLGSIMLAKRFILVGDHNQLPPLVRSKSAIALGLNESLFKILAEQHPTAVATLRKQYRMCQDIQLVANKTVYKDQLVCGSEKVKTQCLEISNSAMSALFCEVCGDSPHCWARQLLDPHKKVLFLDTDAMAATEEQVGMSFNNPKEAALAVNISSSLLACGISEESICIITAFRPQVKLILESLPEVEVSTVDRYQGRDKECVILSFVRSNSDLNVLLGHVTFVVDWLAIEGLESAECGLYAGKE
ncbi:hypothetical protein PSACC_03651 [Paramicrosporidium saccamoebae]|uniref:DNA replication ATP-dependent helicase/nuclease n=1 Tax=Paramicrosporidium saccamoebae TaxID=1246581 RepID=A0A2H9TFN8_9FUNG|nr:hypothetical protein PSACC_03651 [Paramicrosporidium saccamoebae]